MRSTSVWECSGGWGRLRPRGADADVGSVERLERDRSRGARAWEAEGWAVGGEVRETLEALREGGPRKREGGGARWGCAVLGAAADDGERVAILVAGLKGSSGKS